MSTLITLLARYGAEPQNRDAIAEQISQQELDHLIATSPVVCAYEHAPDEQPQRPDDEDDEKEKPSESVRVA